MGWAYGIVDGREVGYSVEACCDEPGCTALIDRGISHRCGNINRDGGCGEYFCSGHVHMGHVDTGWLCRICVVVYECDDPTCWCQEAANVLDA